MLYSHIEARVGVHWILHLQSLVAFISNMQFKTKLANKCGVGSKITKENCHGSRTLSFLKSEYVSCRQVFLAVVLCRWLYSKIQMYKHPVHSRLSSYSLSLQMEWASGQNRHKHGVSR